MVVWGWTTRPPGMAVGVGSCGAAATVPKVVACGRLARLAGVTGRAATIGGSVALDVGELVGAAGSVWGAGWWVRAVMVAAVVTATSPPTRVHRRRRVAGRGAARAPRRAVGAAGVGRVVWWWSGWGWSPSGTRLTS